MQFELQELRNMDINLKLQNGKKGGVSNQFEGWKGENSVENSAKTVSQFFTFQRSNRFFKIFVY